MAMDLAIEAGHYDARQDFSNALKYYETSIEKLMPLVEGEKDVIRKKALTAQVSTSILYFAWLNLPPTGSCILEKS